MPGLTTKQIQEFYNDMAALEDKAKRVGLDALEKANLARCHYIEGAMRDELSILKSGRFKRCGGYLVSFAKSDELEDVPDDKLSYEDCYHKVAELESALQTPGLDPDHKKTLLDLKGRYEFAANRAKAQGYVLRSAIEG
jgi:hypothetical protein